MVEGEVQTLDEEEQLIPEKGASAVIWKWFGYRRSDVNQTSVI